MVVTHMRIDDRLIHGQIVTAWISDSKAEEILVADDMAAEDPTQQMLLKLAVPAKIKLAIVTVEKAAELLKEDQSDTKVLLIVRNPKTALDLFERGFTIESVNVGNISNARSTVGRKRLLPYIYVEPEDVENLKAIAEKNIRLDVRAVPNDKSIDGLALISK